MRQIEEERVPAGAADKAHCLIRVSLGERSQIHRRFDNLRVVHQNRRFLVVAVRNSVIFIEAARGWQILRCTAQVPLADAHRFISGRFQHLRDSDFVSCKPARIVSLEYGGNAGTHPIPSRQN